MLKFFSTLRSRLILLIVLTAIPGIVLVLRSGLEQRQQAIQSAQEEVVHLGRIASTTQDVMVNNIKAFLQTVAHQSSIQAGDMSECQETLAHLVTEHFLYYSAFYVADLDGHVLCSPVGKHPAPDFDNCDHYKNLVKADDFTLSGYHICRQTGEAVLSVGYPIYDDQGQRIMVTNVSLDLVWFYDFAVAARLPEGAELIVIDEAGTILSYYPDNDNWRGHKVKEAGVLLELFGQPDGMVVGKGPAGEESLYASTAVYVSEQPILVVLGVPTRVAFAEANQILSRDLVVLLLVTVMVIGLVWGLGDALIVKQAQALVQATQRLAGGDLAARANLDYESGEMGKLAQAFDGMAATLARRESEREQAQQALQEYALNLERSNKELRDFTNIASHDLQEPLRKIQTFGELLQTRCAPALDKCGTEYIQRMQEAAQRMQILIDELLSYSRVTTRANPFARVELAQVARQVLSDLNWQIEKKGAQVELKTLPALEADPIQMYQLLQNLIANSLKFHAEGQPPVVRIHSSSRNGMCEIVVEDEGIGFDEKYRERIFQPFQRLHGRNEYEGTGMGLAICRKIADRHGGSIEASATPGKGAKFVIRLPYKQRNERPGIE